MLWTVIALIVDLLIRIGFSVRVIMRRRRVGVSLAWLFLILAIPFAGAIIYLLLGELRLGSRRALRAVQLHRPYQDWLRQLQHRAKVDWSKLSPASEPLAQLTERAVGVPPLPGNALQLIGDWQHVFRAIIRDIRAAKRTCHLEFYIWHVGGVANDVADALMDAAKRGVICRVLVDDVGSTAFLKNDLAQQMREAGVQVRAALPANLLRGLAVRFDLRMHRKIAVIDGRVAYTGSLNIVDPRYFRQNAGVGHWVDAMVRVEGPAVEALGIAFLEDWAMEADDDLAHLEETGDVHPLTPRGNQPVQVIPSGPATTEDAMARVLVSAIYAARRELVLTTPYFVPDEDLLAALVSAAQRGADVTLVLPARVDSRLVRLASRSIQGDLVDAGVNVMKYQKGLLHTKSVTVDGEISLFGSLNLDPRSLHLNFEITLAVYDKEFTSQLRELQLSYVAQATPMDLDAWNARSGPQRFAENTARLMGPLL